jgi:hypothetical protein
MVGRVAVSLIPIALSRSGEMRSGATGRHTREGGRGGQVYTADATEPAPEVPSAAASLSAVAWDRLTKSCPRGAELPGAGNIDCKDRIPFHGVVTTWL